MKCVKEVTRKYYKCSYSAWTQPVLTDNGVMGENAFACSSDPILGTRYAWYAFNNTLGTDYDTFLLNTNSGSLFFYNPDPLRISKLTVTNRNEVNVRAIRNGILYGSNNYVDWTQICTFTNSNYTANAQWDINVNATNSYKYFKFYMGEGDGTYVGLNELSITADKQSSQESTIEDYDYYLDIPTYKVYGDSAVRHYYKYQYTPYTRPNLTSNGSDPNFKILIADVNGGGVVSNAWHVFDGNNSTGIGAWYIQETWFNITYIIEFANPVNITSTTWWIRAGNINNHQYGDTITTFGSNDGANWTQLGQTHSGNFVYDNVSCPVTNTEYYKFYKWTQAVGGYDNDETGTNEFYITGTERTVIPGTESDYDFYLDLYDVRAMR